MDTVVFSANRGYALKSSRENIIRHFIDQGWRVVIASADDEDSRYLCALGAILEPVIFSRGGVSLVSDIKAYLKLTAIFRHYRPSLIHNFHAKPIILGSISARRVLFTKVKIVNTITGLGHAFITGGWVVHLASLGYRAALSKSDITVFQNRDDHALFMKNAWVNKTNSRLIIGSGVDVKSFSLVDRSHHAADSPVIVMLGRLLKQKGIPDFILVARNILDTWPKARFIWAGELDTVHPDSVTEGWIKSQIYIEYVGRLKNVRHLLASADVLLFPSYREGVPRAVMEAAATGLPTVGYEVPGVREAVRDGETGYLVPAGDVNKLTMRVSELIASHALRVDMGNASRRLAEQEFDIQIIHNRYIDLYRELMDLN